MILIKNATVYDPQPLGVQDILVENGKILAMGESLQVTSNAFEVEVMDAQGQIVVPGYIDQHVHVIGGGGEAGPYSRTPEVVLSDFITSGITTTIGVLGTDGTTRHPESLLSKVRGLEHEGITAYMLTGSYELPLVTLTGDARHDVILIDKVLGIGEVAISDHRSSQPTLEELKRVVTQSRVGGMLAGKAGVVQFHVGSGETGISVLFDILDQTEIPARHMIPTHINRSIDLLNQGIAFAKRGGYIDITSGMDTTFLTAAQSIRLCKEGGAPMHQVTMSSDGNGSMAVYNEFGQVERLLVAKMDSLHRVLRSAIVDEGLSPKEVFPICTENVAKANGLWPQKGCVAPGSDADLLFLDADYQIQNLMAKGQFLLREQEVLVKGTFE